MPVRELMTWVPSQRRWTKMYAGKRYYVSARQLGCQETKDASLHAANQWWRDKQAELDYAMKARASQQLRIPQPLDDLYAASTGIPHDSLGDLKIILAAALRRDQAQSKGAPPEEGAEPLDILLDGPAQPLYDPGRGRREEVAPEQEDAEQRRRREIMGLLEELLFGKAKLPEDIASKLPPARAAQLEAGVEALRGEALASDPRRTLKALSEEWLHGQRVSASAGHIVPLRFHHIRLHLSHFLSFVGETSDVSIVNAERLEGFYHYCLNKVGEKQEGNKEGWSEVYARCLFGDVRRFVRWLWERDLIELPRNLTGRSFRFHVSADPICTWTNEEVYRVIDAASGPLKVALLLMANCGMTQQDAADLIEDEVDWQAGTITRRRSKTRRKKNVPIVTYRLWPLTLELLRKHRSGEKTVLLNSNGKPFVRRGATADTARHVDQFRFFFDKLRKRMGFDKPLKQLRKTSSTLLETHPVYGRFSALFLGHAPHSMKDRHYTAPPQALFDEAVLWLGQQYGFVEEAN